MLQVLYALYLRYGPWFAARFQVCLLLQVALQTLVQMPESLREGSWARHFGKVVFPTQGGTLDSLREVNLGTYTVSQLSTRL